jgi:hypothetical protein
MSDNLQLDPAPAVVRQAFWLAVLGFLLVGAKTVAGATVLTGFDAALEAAGTLDEVTVDRIHQWLVVAVILGAVLTVVLGLAAMAVARRADTSRTLVGFLVLAAVAGLLLGVVFSPENEIHAESAADLAQYELLVPAWFQSLSAITVLVVVVLFGVVLVRMGRAAAAEYYQDYDPAARWRGYGSWLDLIRRR